MHSLQRLKFQSNKQTKIGRPELWYLFPGLGITLLYLFLGIRRLFFYSLWTCLMGIFLGLSNADMGFAFKSQPKETSCPCMLTRQHFSWIICLQPGPPLSPFLSKTLLPYGPAPLPHTLKGPVKPTLFTNLFSKVSEL